MIKEEFIKIISDKEDGFLEEVKDEDLYLFNNMNNSEFNNYKLLLYEDIKKNIYIKGHIKEFKKDLIKIEYLIKYEDLIMYKEETIKGKIHLSRIIQHIKKSEDKYLNDLLLYILE